MRLHVDAQLLTVLEHPPTAWRKCRMDKCQTSPSHLHLPPVHRSGSKGRAEKKGETRRKMKNMANSATVGNVAIAGITSTFRASSQDFVHNGQIRQCRENGSCPGACKFVSTTASFREKTSAVPRARISASSRHGSRTHRRHLFWIVGAVEATFSENEQRIRGAGETGNERREQG